MTRRVLAAAAVLVAVAVPVLPAQAWWYLPPAYTGAASGVWPRPPSGVRFVDCRRNMGDTGWICLTDAGRLVNVPDGYSWAVPTWLVSW